MNSSKLHDFVHLLATDCGFDRCGCTSASPVEHADFYREWLADGCAGTMDYLGNYLPERFNPARLLPGAKTVIVTALNYRQPEPANEPEFVNEPESAEATDNSDRNESWGKSEPRGRVAMYAWGADYHKVVKAKLFKMVDALRAKLDQPFDAKVCVDTAPILERQFAQRAGIGWIGKNTMSISRELGSYYFLGEIVTTLEMEYDEPAAGHCGNCTRCIDACPTGALSEPYRLDASKCISYLTIENRQDGIPQELHGPMGDWVFGCDVCQQVCPHNIKNRDKYTKESKFTVRSPAPNPNLDDLRNWTDEQYRENLTGSAMKRAKPDMLRRNAGIALENKNK